MKKIQIGISKLTPGWQIILDQIGVNYCQILQNKPIDPNDYSLLVINSDDIELEFLNKWSAAGGAILWEALAYCSLNNIHSKTRFLKSILPKFEYKFLGIIDFYCKFTFPLDDSLIIKDQKLGITRKELNIVLPFSLNNLILDDRKMRKRFYAKRDELPSELVNKVSKGRIRILVQSLMEELHHKQKLPFVHKWYFPKKAKSVFIFRVDTDFCNSEDASMIFETCEKQNINGSWFLDTESEDKIENTYLKFVSQELGLHCDTHIVFEDFENNLINLQNGLNKLNKFKINPKGFAAPYGQWNCNLGKAVEFLDFHYSTEFSLDYDNLPFYPFVDDHFSKVLQLPIHPISPGRLRRSHFSSEEMKIYFREVTNRCINMKIPVIIYHHPHHQLVEILDEYFAYINQIKLPKITMLEYTNWWEKRNLTQSKIKYDGKNLIAEDADMEMFYRISTSDGEKIISLDKPVEANSELQQFVPLKCNETCKMRKWNWRDLLYNYESYHSKKKMRSKSKL